MPAAAISSSWNVQKNKTKKAYNQSLPHGVPDACVKLPQASPQISPTVKSEEI